VAALHAEENVHGNVHPGTILVADDGRVVLSDARADEATPEHDVRSIGAVLYAALTGHWPHAEAGYDQLTDGPRDAVGNLASPRQVRAGIPAYISDLTMRLLDPRTQPPTAEALAQELSRLDTEANDEFFSDGPLGFAVAGSAPEGAGRGSTGRKIVIGIVALLVIATAGILLSRNLGGGGNPQQAGVTDTSPTGGASAPAGTSSGAPVKQVSAVPLTASSLRLIETAGDESFNGDAGKIVDGDENTYWKSSWYRTAKFGNLKTGMGLLIDLGAVKNVTSVQVDFLTPDEQAQAFTGSFDPGPGNANSKKIIQGYKPVGNSGPQDAASTTVFPIGTSTQYVLIWVTKLPPADGYSKVPNTYLFGINEVKVFAQ